MKWSRTSRFLGASALACILIAGCKLTGQQTHTACNWPELELVPQPPEVIYGPYQYPVIAVDQGPPFICAAAPTVTSAAEGASEVQPTSGNQAMDLPPRTVELAAPPKYSHAPDYSWLCGQVEQDRGTWRLRYAPADVGDPHGGCVTLTGDGVLVGLQDGNFIRVQGRLVSANSGSPVPQYWVESMAFWR